MYKIRGGSKLLDNNIILSKAELAEGMRIADFGCGATGHFVFPASKMVGKTGSVYAVDIQRTVLETIKRRARQEGIDNIKPLWSNLEIYNATNIEASSLDLVLLVNTLYQSHKRVEIIREGVRVLKKGGKLIIVEWKKVHIPFGPPVEERVDMNALKTAAPKLGLLFEKEFFTGTYHYGLLFIKA
jgi:ubiquinone/menaquinone biosynthesis C-methylase UbiE